MRDNQTIQIIFLILALLGFIIMIFVFADTFAEIWESITNNNTASLILCITLFGKLILLLFTGGISIYLMEQVSGKRG